MLFSQNPFSVSSFGESFEQVDIVAVLTGVSANTELGTVNVVGEAPNVEVVLTGTQATGAIGSLSVSTQATINITLDAITSFIGTLATSSESNVSLNGVTANTIVNTSSS